MAKKPTTKSKGRILVIDDSEVALDMIRTELEAAGYEVITRDSPFGTGASILRAQPDMVLLDVTMPVLSGEDVVRNVRENHKLQDTCIILHSGGQEAELIEMAKRSGADGCIVKSGIEGALAKRVEEILSKRQAPR